MRAPDEPDVGLSVDEVGRRVSFQLTYSRSPVERTFNCAGLTGPVIPDAYGGATPAYGGWDDEHLGTSRKLTGEQCVSRFMQMSLQEAVHEVLEWFRVDGDVVLDPHSQDSPCGGRSTEKKVQDAVDDLAAALWRLVTDERKESFGRDILPGSAEGDDVSPPLGS